MLHLLLADVLGLSWLAHGRVYLPGHPEPKSLYRKAEERRVLAQLNAERRAARRRRPEAQGVLGRLRLVLGRA